MDVILSIMLWATAFGGGMIIGNELAHSTRFGKWSGVPIYERGRMSVSRLVIGLLLVALGIVLSFV